ncbi:hypothetical protein [Candidatus Uabimicrobium sp. HlEnr_7]|uniref:hypothetical protein n=1 Tax=Candidatus Uabimicrobium helgolandensis TaxID=3095367 RepID=UPI003557B0D0
MNYKIGFPVDGGCIEKTFFVEVQLRLSQKHYCTNGLSSRLRPKSGAEFVFNCAPLYIQNRYKFEFTPIPMPNPSTRPDTIADSGYSDALACAIALEKASCKQQQPSKLVLLSCSFLWHEQNHGLKNLKIERVINDDFTQKKSLYHKWMIAQKSCAKALFLHEKDAEVLRDNYNVPFTLLSHLNQGSLWNRKTPVVVSCKTNDYDNIKKLLISRRKLPYIRFAIAFIVTVALAIIIFSYSKKNQKIIIENIAKELTIANTRNLNWNDQQQQLVQQIGDDVLLKCLKSKDWRVWFVALKIVGERKQNQSVFIEAIMENISHKRFQPYVVSTLLKLRPSFEQMLEYTLRDYFMISKTAMHVLQKMTINDNFPTAILKKYLQHKKSRKITLELIWRIPGNKNTLLPQLFSFLLKKSFKESSAQAICSVQQNLNNLLLKQLKKNAIPQQTILEILQVTSLQYPLSFRQLELLKENYPNVVAEFVISSQDIELFLNYLFEKSDNNPGWSEVLTSIRLEKQDNHVLPLITEYLRKKTISENLYVKHLLRFVCDMQVSSPQINKVLVDLLGDSVLYKSVGNTILALHLQTIDIKKVVLFYLHKHHDKAYFSELCGKLNITAAIAPLEQLLKKNENNEIIIAVALANLGNPQYLYEMLKAPQKLSLSSMLYLSRNIIAYNNKNLMMVLKNCYENHKNCDAMSLPLFLSSGDFKYFQAISTEELIAFFKQIPVDSKIILLKRYIMHREESLRVFAIWQLYCTQKNSRIFVDYLDQVSVDRSESIEYCLLKCKQLKPEGYKQTLKKIARYPFYWKYRAMARKILSLK